MKLHQQHPKLEASQPKMARLLAAAGVLVAVGFVLFTNPAASARQANPVSGSGEVMHGLAAPGAGQIARDPSVPDAAEALRGLRLQQPAVVAPTF